jgi:Zn-dependent protease with chaperone function
MFGGKATLLPAFVIGSVMNLFGFFFSDRIALLAVRATKISAGDDPVLWNMVERLSQKAGLLMSGVVHLSSRGRPLANALRKLENANRQIPLQVPDSLGNIFTVAPLTGSDVARLFMTHPPIVERIRRLMDIA